MKKNITIISIIGMLLLSSFMITPALGAGPGTPPVINISNPNPEDGSIDVDTKLSAVSVDIEITGNFSQANLYVQWEIGGDYIKTNKSKEPYFNCICREASIDTSLPPNTEVIWYVDVYVIDLDLYKNAKYSFVTGDNPPVANFTNKTHGLRVDFDGTSSYDSDGTITNYTWYFGDGTIGYENITQHLYENDGSYPVSLNVTDDGGNTDNKTVIVNVENSFPTANFESSIDGKKVTFDASASSDKDGTIENYTWNFGDTKIGYGKIIDHTYDKEGETYTVTLKVTDNKGNYSTISKDIKINDTTNPTVEIIKPAKKGIYVNNEFRRSRLLGMPFIIGDITIEVNATDDGSGIEKVEFYIGNSLQGNDTSVPYTFNWTKGRIRLFHIFRIKVVAHDNAGNQAEAKMVVRKIL